MSKVPQNSRQLAFFALRSLRVTRKGSVHQGAFADVALDQVLRQSGLPDLDRRLVTELVYGAVRRQRSLDALIDQFAKKKAIHQPPDLRVILHLGFYQLRYLDQIPDSAAVNTTVDLAKQNGFPGLTGFVNGLLRQYLRASETADPLQLPDDPIARLGILHSFPDWIVQVWFDQFGLEDTEALCEWMNRSPHIVLRINTLKTTLEKVESALQTAGIQTQRVSHLPQALQLQNPGAIQKLPGFQAGEWIVQDSSAQLVSYLLDPQPQETIVDACAAPGGKTMHLAELMSDCGTVWAVDKTPSRLKKLRENADRLGLQSIQICTGDSRDLPQFVGKCDRVLVDAPCSGLGTLNRHADARWRQTPESVEELAQLQQAILNHAATWVKSKGILVYATCTLHPAENEQIIQKFLVQHPDWQVDRPESNTTLAPFFASEGWAKVLPHQHNMDGFFMIKLKKE